jgi:hypothetical protein
MPPSLLFLDEDLGSLYFLFTIFLFFSQLCKIHAFLVLYEADVVFKMWLPRGGLGLVGI